MVRAWLASAGRLRQHRRQTQVSFCEIGIMFQSHLKEFLGLVELSRVAVYFPQFVRGVGIAGFELQLLLEFFRGGSYVIRRIALPRTSQQGSTQTIMNARSAGIDREHLAIFADGGGVRSLALVGFGLSLMPPDRSWSHLGKLLHGQEGEVPKDLASVVQDLRIARIKLIQIQRHFHRIAVSQQPGGRP